MDPQRWAAIESLYRTALAKDPCERLSYLAVACAEDPTLRSEVESLLAYADAKLSGPAQRSELAKVWDEIAGIPLPETEALDLATAADGSPPTLPVTIGRYRILRLLGEGGMGAVYEAEQAQPRRRVALKVIRPGFTGAELLRRFEQESQALARLQHPGIAQIYEAGSVYGGLGPQPYFAMEFIRGESLLKYAEVHQMSTHQRLELMMKVCEAVQHAHQRGIIHRDLKPGNILVDESGQPKVLDFGVARVTDSDTYATHATDLGQIVGTLAYMSPEQALGDPLELDTRSDVYALGVILYELLSGKLPYVISPKLHEALKTIQDADPAPLSAINRRYRGDVETIVGKALEKDKTRRYSAAAELGADIQNYLRDEPIAARRPSTAYQIQKFARRHRALVLAFTAVFVVLIAGIIVSTWEAAIARRAEQTAITESATAKAINDFLQNDLLAQASANAQAQPGTKPDPDLKVRTALDRAVARVAGKFGKQPLVEASIRQTIGNTYEDLGLYREAQRQVERALDLRHRALGDEHRDTLISMHKLANLYEKQGSYLQAESFYTKALEARRRVLPTDAPDTLDTINDLALLYESQGKYARAEPLFIHVLETRRRVSGEEHADTLDTLTNLAQLYWREGKYAQSEPLFTKVVEIERRVLGEEHPRTLLSTGNLAALYEYQGKYEEAQTLCVKVLLGKQRVLGEEHPDTLAAKNNLAQLYKKQGKDAEAEPLFKNVIEVARRVLGEEHPGTLIGTSNLAELYMSQGRYTEAEALLMNVWNVRRRLLGEDHPSTLITMSDIANLFLYQGKHVQAERLCLKVLELRRRVLRAEHPETLHSMSDLAQIYEDQGQYAEAESLAVKLLEVRQRKLGPQDPDTARALASLGGLRLKEEKYADAERLLSEAIDIFKERVPTNARAWGIYRMQSMLGASLAGQRKYADAEPLLLAGYNGLLERKLAIAVYNLPLLEEAGKRIVQLYQDWGKPRKTIEWREKLRKTKPHARNE